LRRRLAVAKLGHRVVGRPASRGSADDARIDGPERRFMHAHRHRTHIAAAAAVLAGLLLAHAGPAHAQRQSGIQLSPDSARYLISKDVGNERWAISYNLDDKTVTGNVFPLDGGSPSFLACEITSPIAAETYDLSCQFAQPCPEAPCVNQWGAPFPVTGTPRSFFLPTNTLATYAADVQPIYNVSCATSAVCHGNGAEFVVLSSAASYHNTFLVDSNGVNGMRGPFIAPFDPTGSFLFRKLGELQQGDGERMPYNGSALPAEQIEAIRNWILEGAANN
jgi:hypothetical protein